MTTFLMVCEDKSDFQIASGLVDRVLKECGPPWLGELLADQPEAMRTWIGSGQLPFVDIHALDDECRLHNVRLKYGHFNRTSKAPGEPGGPGAQAARNAFLLARTLAKKNGPIDAVLLVWDMDREANKRKRALLQAQQEAEALEPGFKIVLGCPDAMSEAWVLAGFEANGNEETQLLEEERQKLGFSPVAQSHRLDATSNKEGASRHREEPLALKSAKRVLDKLTSNDVERAQQCWRDTALDTLKKHGADNGLASYLDEIEQVILPLVTAVPSPAPP